MVVVLEVNDVPLATALVAWTQVAEVVPSKLQETPTVAWKSGPEDVEL